MKRKPATPFQATGGAVSVKRGRRDDFDSRRVKAAIAKGADVEGADKARKSTVSLHCRYHVFTEDLSVTLLSKIRTDLTFVIKKGVSFGRATGAGKPVTYKAFTECSGIISVPAWYGYTIFGPAAKNRTLLGDPLRSHDGEKISVTATLRSTDDFPQVQARSGVWKFWNDHKDTGAAICTMVMPCGAGKTITSVATTVPMGRRIVFLTHSDDIADQAMETFEDCTAGGLKVGRVQGKTLDVGPEFGVVVMMIPTLIIMIKTHGLEETRKMIRSETFGVVIGDECHHLAAAQFMNTVFLFSARYWLFLTATPDRDDGLCRELEYLTGPIVFRGKEVTGNATILCTQWAPGIEAKMNRFGQVDYMGTIGALCKAEAYNDWACSMAALGVLAGHDVIIFTLRTHDVMPGLAALVHAKLKALEKKYGKPIRRSLVTLDGRTSAAPLVSVVMSGVNKETRERMKPLLKKEVVVGPMEAMAMAREDASRSLLAHTLTEVHGMEDEEATGVVLTADPALREAKVRAFVDSLHEDEKEEVKVEGIMADVEKYENDCLRPRRAVTDLMAAGRLPEVDLVNSSAKFANPHTKKAVAQRHAKVHAKAARVLICTVDKLKEGYNAPNKSMEIFAHSRNGKSTNTQVIGRATRKWDHTKLSPFIIDMAMTLTNGGSFVNGQRKRKSLYKERIFRTMNQRIGPEVVVDAAYWNAISRTLGLTGQILRKPGARAGAGAGDKK